jgi:hypothetical protein
MGHIQKTVNSKMENRHHTKVVGEKFHTDGSVRSFPGNTVISKITPDMPIHADLVKAQERLKAADAAGKYVFLPPSSFHMTVVEGLCDQMRSPQLWSSKLPLDMPLAEINHFVFDCFARLALPPAFTMRISKLTFPRFLAIILEPADAETARSLHDFREQFSRDTGIWFPDHVAYTYHITLAYCLVHLTADEERIIYTEQQEIQQSLSAAYPSIELGRPRLTFFENMFRFDDAC